MLKDGLRALAAIVLPFCLWLGLLLPADAAVQLPPPLLTLTDLPAGFAPASAEEASSCQMAGAIAAFAYRQGTQLTELICVSSFSLAPVAEQPVPPETLQQLFDSILQHPEALIQQANAADTAGLEILKTLEGIGEVATGFSKTEAGIGRTEVALFRRGDWINSVLVRDAVGQAPIASLASVARQVDQHVAQLVPPNR
ncbi:MAG TPA: hypothetical protein V6C57_23390 [Coleofasciculaceae cyanobacterium]